MVQTFATDSSNNDIYLDTSGNIAILTGKEAVGGACQTISRSKLGEMVLTTTQGIPYFEAVFNGVPNLRIWQAFLQNALQNVDGVAKVDNIILNDQSNTLSYTATIQTIYGTIIING